MDEERNTSTVIADDIESESSNTVGIDKNVKERCELICEVKTICNANQIMSSCLSLNNKACDHSTMDKQLTEFVYSNDSADSDSSKQTHNYFTDLQFLNKVIEKEEPKVCTMNIDQDIYSLEKTELKQEIDAFSSLRTEDVKYDTSKPDSQNSSDRLESHNSNESTEQCEDVKRASRRSSKRKKEFDECCPICGVTVRLYDLESHYNQEVEKLSKIAKVKKSHHEEIVKRKTFEEVKKNRESRLTARVARYSARAQSEVKCPVCSLRMSGTAEEINKHVAFCIQDEDSDEVNVVDFEDEDGSESFEEYEFGDQTRIRPISLVPGGYRSLQGQSSNTQAAEDEDLNVDVDDTFTYGEPQYSELDVILDIACEKDKIDLEQLRKAVLTNSSVQPNVLESRKWSNIEQTSTENPELSSRNSTESDPVVSSLKEKIKDLEDQNKSVKCLICLESYTKPVVSTSCWHVHCEECWLMTMGVKKLCPQCNMIVFPSDLRKIYL